MLRREMMIFHGDVGVVQDKGTGSFCCEAVQKHNVRYRKVR